MFNVVLYEPEIPPNTGSIIRLCANCGARLHLIQPLGFTLSDKNLKRAGLDYHEFAKVQVHDNLDACLAHLGGGRIFALSTKGTMNYADVQFQPEDILLFGPESRGLPQHILNSLPKSQILRIPMRADSRSINLANAASVVVYEAWRQNGFKVD